VEQLVRAKESILVSDKEPSPELTLALRSRDAWFKLNTDIGGGFELEAKGGIVVSRSEKGIADLKRLAALQRSDGIDAQEVPGKELLKLKPHLLAVLNLEFCMRKMHSASQCWQQRRLCERFENAVVSFVQGEDVVSIDSVNGKIIWLNN
jgi:glycine/D-amino acid oxidase-like deaminating enzyme